MYAVIQCFIGSLAEAVQSASYVRGAMEMDIEARRRPSGKFGHGWKL